MLKKITLISLIILSPLAIAETQTPPPNNSAIKNSKPYKVVAKTASKTYNSIKNSTPYMGFGLGNQNAKGYNGLYGQVFAGLGMRSAEDTYYVGGEVWVNSGSLPLSQKYFHRTVYGAGVSLMPGIILNHDSLIYARIGTGTFRYNKDLSYFTGGQLGIGFQSKFSDNWDLRGEYVYTGSGVMTGFGNMSLNLFNLALVYNFTAT
ncbi:MAG TPA: outer membrane beta-barrel protein [Gammaproteobacteria bacterium]|nr:outer membrane beta-barrel protein [Gammaproteobacteria bacterium]